MEITAGMVRELREITGAGMMDCKKALTEADGDITAAVDILRTRGLAALAKKAGRVANEGVVAAYVSGDHRVGALVEVNCETDFVGLNDQFRSFANELAAHVATAAPADIETLKSQTLTGRDLSVEQVLGELVSKLGENIAITRFARMVADESGFIGSYVHMGGKIGVLVNVSSDDTRRTSDPAFLAFVKDVAMQVAAASPIAVDRESVSAEVIEHEMSIYRAQAAESGKPHAIQDKMAEGRLQKFFKEVCLMEQPFVKDPEITVQQLAGRVSQEVGCTVSVRAFERFQLGETSDAPKASCGC
ncbi:MAG: translation elongation factor Ts [Actinomycetia bacterium]|nr:translation elongation factor Ts [Actinomycetes bacterium]